MLCNTNEFMTVNQEKKRSRDSGGQVNALDWWLSEPLRLPHPANEATSIRDTGSMKRCKMVPGPTVPQQKIAQSITLFLQLAIFPWCILGSCVLQTCDAHTHTPNHPGDVEDSSDLITSFHIFVFYFWCFGSHYCFCQWTGVTVVTLTGQQLRWDVLCSLTPFYQNQHELLWQWELQQLICWIGPPRASLPSTHDPVTTGPSLDHFW